MQVDQPYRLAAAELKWQIRSLPPPQRDAPLVTQNRFRFCNHIATNRYGINSMKLHPQHIRNFSQRQLYLLTTISPESTGPWLTGILRTPRSRTKFQK